MYGGRSYTAIISDARQFNPESRTLEIRLEMENPGMLLRPDMFVDVQVDSHGPPGLSVPFDSILDSGRSKVVFVARGNGVFEPRKVSLGTEYDDHVQVIGGLSEGEDVVSSGTFLLDSESRLHDVSAVNKAVPINASLVTAKKILPSNGADPVCGMPLGTETHETASYQGEIIRFCSKTCKSKFEKNPVAYIKNKKLASAPLESRGNS